MSEVPEFETAKEAYIYVLNEVKGCCPELESKIATDPEYSFRYAGEILKGRFPEGEAAIAQNVVLAYYYAKKILKGRFPEGEAVIATHPDYSCLYAIEVIKGRWPEGEEAILKHGQFNFVARYTLLLHRDLNTQINNIRNEVHEKTKELIMDINSLRIEVDLLRGWVSK
jgi:hypothetical protein